MKLSNYCLAVIALFFAASPSVFPQQPDGVTVEVSGGGGVFRVSDPIAGTDDDAKFQVERWGPELKYEFSNVPPGDYTLVLAFAEIYHKQAGKRVMSVAVNGLTVLEDYDICADVGPDTAVLKRLAVTVPADGRLEIHFTATVDKPKISFIQLFNDEYFIEVLPEDDGGVQETAGSDYADNLFENSIAKLGSRFCLNPQPQVGKWVQSPMGTMMGTRRWFLLAARSGDVVRALPFDHSFAPFEHIEQTLTMTSISYRCFSPELGYNVQFKISAPFYPRDRRLSCAPFFFLDVTVANTSDRRQSARLALAMPGFQEADLRRPGLIGLRSFSTEHDRNFEQVLASDGSDGARVAQDVGRVIGRPRRKTGERDAEGRLILPVNQTEQRAGIVWRFVLEPGEAKTHRVVLAAYTADDALEVRYKPFHFLYADLFDDAEDVIAYALDNADEIERKNSVFESTVTDATVPDSLKEFIAYAFQSFICNTWWCRADDGSEWFSVWEGNCRYHSTVDVEYNDGLIFYQYWPELLGRIIDSWPKYMKPGVISHDMGAGLVANGMSYPHDMEIEENTNFILMLHHYWKCTGNLGIVRRHFDVVRDLCWYIITADTDGDGFPNRGCANTIDQGSHAIQYAQEQTYLAVRCLAALTVAREMARALGEPSAAAGWREHAERIRQTLQNRAWLGDHYAVYLGEEETTDDWRAYSMYAQNGLVYPLRGGATVPVSRQQMRKDIEVATRKLMREYGTTHTTLEDNMWISQCIWRDIAAAYLGIDMIDNINRYWALARKLAFEHHRCYTDSYFYNGGAALDYYPRGITAIGLIYALGGVQIDVPGKSITFNPLRTPLRIPLPTFADWKAGKVPWVTFEEKDGELTFTVENRECLAGLNCSLRSRH